MKALFCCLLFFCLTVSGFAHPPYGIAVDEDGTIYFADILHYERGATWQFNQGNEPIAILKDFHAHYLKLQAPGVFVSAVGEGTHALIRWDHGDIETIYSSEDHRNFNGVTWDISESGEVYYAADKKIRLLYPEGEQSAFSEHEYEWINMVYVGRAGDVFSIDQSVNGGTIYLTDAEGNTEKLASGLISTAGTEAYDKHADILLGMYQDENGDLYVTDISANRILRIKPDGSFKDYYAMENGWTPSGLTKKDGTFYILAHKSSPTLDGPGIFTLDEGMNLTQILDMSEANTPPANIDLPTDYEYPYYLFGVGILGGGFMFGLLLLLRHRSSNEAIV